VTLRMYKALFLSYHLDILSNTAQHARIICFQMLIQWRYTWSCSILLLW